MRGTRARSARGRAPSTASTARTTTTTSPRAAAGGASAPGSSAGHAAETQYALLIEQMQHRELTSEDLQLFMSLEQQASKEGYTPGPSSSGLYRGLAGGLAGPAGPSSWTGAGSAGPGSVGTGSVGSLGTDSVGPYKPHSALGSLGGGSVT